MLLVGSSVIMLGIYVHFVVRYIPIVNGIGAKDMYVITFLFDALWGSSRLHSQSAFLNKLVVNTADSLLFIFLVIIL